MRRPAVRTSLAALAGLGLLLSGCSAEGAPSGTTSSADGINVVASTNVYGDIAKAVGGEKVNVTAIINKTSQDPHSYEATAQDRLAISKAELVIENGGGYDGFLHKMADDSNIGHGNILTAVDVAGVAVLRRRTESATSPAGSAGSS